MGVPHQQEEKAHVAIKGSEVGPVHVLKFPSSPPKSYLSPTHTRGRNKNTALFSLNELSIDGL